MAPTEQQTIRATLRRTFIYAGRSYGPGTVEIPEALAVSLGISTGPASPASASAASGDAGASNAGAADTGAPGAASVDAGFDAATAAEQYEHQSKPELEQLAAARGLTVTRADGSEGVPLKSDYVAALVQADAEAAANAAAAPSA